MPPNVTINGCTPNLLIISPWTSPHNITINIAKIIPSHKGQLYPMGSGIVVFAINTPVNPIIDPTDKSIPPDIITKATPILNIPTIAICRIRFNIFEESIKLMLEMPTMAETKTITNNSPKLLFVTISMIKFSQSLYFNRSSTFSVGVEVVD
jgi:hypothetical protein